MAIKKRIPRKKQNKAYAIARYAIPVALIGAGLWLTFRKSAEVVQLPPAGGTNTGTSTGNTTTSGVFPLKRGMYDNANVQALQRGLNKIIEATPALKLNKLSDDGDFGPLTETALYKIAGVVTVDQILYNNLTSRPLSWFANSY